MFLFLRKNFFQTTSKMLQVDERDFAHARRCNRWKWNFYFYPNAFDVLLTIRPEISYVAYTSFSHFSAQTKEIVFSCAWEKRSIQFTMAWSFLRKAAACWCWWREKRTLLGKRFIGRNETQKSMRGMHMTRVDENPRRVAKSGETISRGFENVAGVISYLLIQRHVKCDVERREHVVLVERKPDFSRRITNLHFSL